jgi:hypothetical protein
MANRFYFSNVAAPISPAFDAGWEQTGQAVRLYSPRKGLTTDVSALANSTAVTIPITTTQQVLVAQFITDPFPFPCRLGGNFSMVVRGLENATTNNVFLAYVLRLLSKDGGTVRATLASSMTNTGTEYAATAATRIISGTAISGAPVAAEAGDRLCLEVGGHAQAPTAAGSHTLRFGYISQADFALTSALTTDLNPWWELSEEIWSQMPNNHQYFSGGNGTSFAEGWR